MTEIKITRRLSDAVVAERMVELRNLRHLHARDRQQIKELKAENKVLRADNQELKSTVATLQIQIAELQTMIFGKKRRPPGGMIIKDDRIADPKAHRDKSSYRRQLPPASAITDTQVIAIDHCKCGGELKDITTHERYQEDIPLPELTTDYQPKLVTKYIISRGICSKCGKANSAKDLGGQAVTLGPNVRLLVCHLIGALGMSYTQVTSLVLGLYGIHITDGEVALILHKQHENWLPAYDQLKTDIRAAPVVHVDETPWNIQKNDGLGYAWSLSDANSEKVYFSLENSRGARHARKIFGADTDKPFAGVRISDDYGGYRNVTLPGTQQLCWAHLYRCIRDLRYNSNLPKEQLNDVVWWYEQFASIYQDLRAYLDQPYDQQTRTDQSDALWNRLQAILPASITDPAKLARLKAQLTRSGQPKLFTCLTHSTPCDNNRAERNLRQLVLKRKRSFGSQTEKGATALSTILSLCTTTWRMQPNGYFKALAELG